MENAITAILFIMLAIDIPTTIAYLLGLRFQIDDFNCKEEVRDVKTNILVTKVIQVLNAVALIALMVLTQIYFLS